LVAVAGIPAEGCDQFRHPTEVTAYLVEHLLPKLLGRIAIVKHIDDDGRANDALIEHDVPLCIVLSFHAYGRKHQQVSADVFQQLGVGFIFNQGVDERMVELVNER